MRTLRTLFWVVITALLVGFIAMNWSTAPVNIWPQDAGYLHFEWPVGIIALVFFLLGLTPMWLLHKITRWTMRRKLDSAERSVSRLDGQIEQYRSLIKAGELQFEAGRRTLAQLIQLHDSRFNAQQRRADQQRKLQSAQLRRLSLTGNLLPSLMGANAPR